MLAYVLDVFRAATHTLECLPAVVRVVVVVARHTGPATQHAAPLPHVTQTLHGLAGPPPCTAWHVARMSATHDFQVGDVVLAKVKGYPAWPGILVDDAHVPRAVREERPSTKTVPHTVRFFPAADYHWSSARDLKPLTPHDIEAFLTNPKNKSGALREAYELAKDPHAWNEKQNGIVKEHDAWVEEHGEEEDEEGEDDEDEEEDEEDDEDDERKAAPATKRRSSRATPTAKRARTDEPAEEPEAAATTAAVREQDEELDPATRKVREWRHKLQRAFLSKAGVIVAEDMDAQDATFKTVEAYQDMTVDQLKATKIGKVMKRIYQLPDIPRDDEFHFRDRAGELMKRWSALIGSHAPSEDNDA